MAKLFYDTQDAGSTLVAYDDGQRTDKADLEAARDDLLDLLATPDTLREDIAKSGIALSAGIFFPKYVVNDPSEPNLDALGLLDRDIGKELDRILDILDYFDYIKDAPPIGKVVSHGYFLPEAIEAPLPDDNGTDVVANAIDAVNGGDQDPNDPLNTKYWQSQVAGDRVLIVRLRGYPKRVEGIRLRTNSGDTRAQLQNLDVHASNVLGQIDDPENIMATGVNVDGAANWFELAFTKPKCRFVKLVCRTSAFTKPDIIRIRSLQIRVGVTNHEK